MWILPVTRRELVDLIAPRRGADIPGVVEVDRLSFDIVRSETMAAVWPARPSEFGRLPTAIIVPEGSRRDLLAWLATYVRDFRPFTAFCRVVERSMAEHFLTGPTAPNLLGLEGICSGLILGEALTHARGRTSILDLPSTTYSATLSHAISRAIALTGRSVPPDVITKLWTQAREMTGQIGLGVAPNATLAIWAVVLGVSEKSQVLFEPSDVLTAAWHDLTTIGEIRDPAWRRLVEGLPDLERVHGLLEMPREQRVHIVDMALKFLVSIRRDNEEERSFLAGYLTSLLGPGTLDHADFLAPIVGTLPSAYLWYGLCAGINAKRDALPSGNPLARRIVRDLTVSDRLIDRPRCDIAIEELALNGPGDSLLRLTAKAGRLDIDLLPGVTTAVRWPPHEVPIEDDVRKAARDAELQHLLLETEETALHWRHLTERLRAILNIERVDRQTTNRRKRGGKS